MWRTISTTVVTYWFWRDTQGRMFLHWLLCNLAVRLLLFCALISNANIQVEESSQWSEMLTTRDSSSDFWKVQFCHFKSCLLSHLCNPFTRITCWCFRNSKCNIQHQAHTNRSMGIYRFLLLWPLCWNDAICIGCFMLSIKSVCLCACVYSCIFNWYNVYWKGDVILV